MDGRPRIRPEPAQAAAEFAKTYLLVRSGTGTDIAAAPKVFTRGRPPR
ncbi:hypothetical protein [Streptomyces sp. NPDC005281]